MRRNWLHYLLIFVIAGLPALALDDVYAFDPLAASSSEQNSSSNHFIDIKNSNDEASMDESNFLVDDCSNCSSCFCCHFFTLSSVSFNSSLNIIGQHIVDYDLSIFDNFNSPLLRPPKFNLIFIS